MIPVSGNYNPFPSFRRVGVGVEFGVVDVDSKRVATPSASEAGFLPYVSRTINDIYSPTAAYASFEPDLWRLDGTFEVLPDNTDGVETGWWTTGLSGADGVFSSPPWVRYTFSSPVSSIGWMLYFDDLAGTYASSVRATCYDASGAVVDTYTFECREPVARIGHEVAQYYSVLFEFLATDAPFRRVRLCEIDFGLREKWDAERVGNVVMLSGLDPMGAAFPAREARFSFDNSDKIFDIFSPDGIYRYLQQGQTIDISLSVGGDSVYMGQFLFSSVGVESSPIAPVITAYDVVMRLDGETAPVGNDANTTLSAAVSAVLGDTAVSVVYGDGCASRAVRNSIGENTTKREALRLFAQAAMCAIWTDRYGVLHIAPVDEGVSVREYTADALYDYTGISVTTLYDMAEVTSAPINGDKAVYMAGSGKSVISVSNPCVAASAGAAVAAWVLSVAGRRRKYAVRNRCDPAVEVGDTVTIHDIYRHVGSAVVTSQEVTFNGGLAAVTGGVGQ